MLVCSFALGTAGSGISLLPDLVIAAAVDKDSVAEGRNRSGSFFGARQICNRVGSAVASKLSGLVLAHVGYSASAGQQGASAQLGIALVGFAFPAAAYLGASCLAALVDIKPAQPDDKSIAGGKGGLLTSPRSSKKKLA
jgi:Na+/melibiose symporter-like transporter